MISTQPALNVTAGLFIDEGGYVFPVTNWFDSDNNECAREDATVCVAGEGGCWFALRISDFSETGGRA